MITEFPETLPADVYYQLMTTLGANPIYSTSNGKRVMMLRGLCHHSTSGHYSVIFDFTDTHKITCMSSCGDTVMWWNYVKRALNLQYSQEAKDWIIDWLNDKKVDVPITIIENNEVFLPFNPNPKPMVPGINKQIIKEIYSNFDGTKETLEKTVWHTQDKIDVDIMHELNVAVDLKRETIILPHHNINGEIVGLYERNFRPLRAEIKAKYPELSFKELLKFPKAKYLPLMKEDKYIDENDESHCKWSFKNTQNLYGLHLAKDSIKETGTAIVVEGAKSVMLLRQNNIKNVVASHTFGMSENHVAMLIACGAKRLYLGFDKQYQTIDDDNIEWLKYQKKTKGLADRVKDYVEVYRMIDKGNKLKYKDAPIDEGIEVFKQLYDNAEPLTKIIEPTKRIVRRQEADSSNYQFLLNRRNLWEVVQDE